MIGPILATLVTAPHGDILQDSFVVLSVDGTTEGHKTKLNISNGVRNRPIYTFSDSTPLFRTYRKADQNSMYGIIIPLQHITKYDILVMYIPIMFPNESDEAIPNDFCGWCTLIMTDDSAEYFSHF